LSSPLLFISHSFFVSFFIFFILFFLSFPIHFFVSLYLSFLPSIRLSRMFSHLPVYVAAHCPHIALLLFLSWWIVVRGKQAAEQRTAEMWPNVEKVISLISSTHSLWLACRIPRVRSSTRPFTTVLYYAYTSCWSERRPQHMSRCVVSCWLVWPVAHFNG
jgi:hypothetical protein